MFKQLKILFIIDIIVIVAWYYWANAFYFSQGDSMGVVLIIPFLILLSGMLGIILQFKQKAWADAVLINVLIASLIFIAVFGYEVKKKDTTPNDPGVFVK